MIRGKERRGQVVETENRVNVETAIMPKIDTRVDFVHEMKYVRASRTTIVTYNPRVTNPHINTLSQSRDFPHSNFNSPENPPRTTMSALKKTNLK